MVLVDLVFQTIKNFKTKKMIFWSFEKSSRLSSPCFRLFFGSFRWDLLACISLDFVLFLSLNVLNKYKNYYYYKENYYEVKKSSYSKYEDKNGISPLFNQYGPSVSPFPKLILIIIIIVFLKNI